MLRTPFALLIAFLPVDLPVDLAVGLAGNLTAAEPFPLVMPLDGGPQGLVDLSFLNHRPAGSRGAVTVRDGHFVLAGSGERIRFLGVALTFAAAFPEPEVAKAMAQRFARLGINAVRIHFIDGGPNNRFGRHSIWDPAFPKEPRLDPAQLARLDRLLMELRQQGIYYNLNLKVGRTFGIEDGLGEGYFGAGAIPQITKSYDLVDPQLIALQHSYAEAFLSHVNPLTGWSYAHDPAVLAIEMNNENSIIMPNQPLDGPVGWPEKPAAAMRAAWNRWLVAHYADAAAVRAAWAVPRAAAGEPLVLTPASWHLEQNVSGKASLTTTAEGFTATVATTNGSGWHVQMTLPLPAVTAGNALTLVARMRADHARPVTFRSELAVAPWSPCGLDSAVPLSSEWRTIHLPFTVLANAEGGTSRIVLRLGAARGVVELVDLQIVHGLLAPPLPADADPALGTMPLPIAPQGKQRSDWLACIVATEQAFVQGMRDHLQRLGVTAPVICGQASWGPLTGLAREQLSDYVDEHQYWDHPNGWRDPATMRGHGKPLVAVLGGASPLAELARWRVAGVPFSVSEFNHCAPNPHRAEALPLLATVAALQDWDALILHEYGAPPTPLAMVWQPFETGSDPALMAFFPSAALAFRQGAVGSLVAGEFRPVGADAAGAWTAADAGSRLLQARIGLDAGRPAADHAVAPTGWGLPGSASAALSGGTKTVYACGGPRVAVFAGFLAGEGKTVAVDGCRFTAESAFGALAVNTLDGRPLPLSQRILITALAGSSNTEMQRKADGTGLDSWGRAPVLVDGLAGDLDLQIAPGLRARALDAAGVPLQEVPLTAHGDRMRLHLDPTIPAVWYLIDERS